MTTKECILYETLELFSNKGFESVSMRDIGAAVGIRESSIYKHYSGKQAILDAIIEKALYEIDKMFVDLNVPDTNDVTSISRYQSMELEEVANLCSEMLLKQKKNNIVMKFRKFLTIEQFHNESLRDIFIEIFMNRQLMYIEKVFQNLLEFDVLKGESAKMMALQFYSPFFLLQYKLQDDEENLEMEIKECIISFLREHLKGE
ncbi:MAG: TetR/AcrR family transcriptional regulator [bacterium]|nr:TetR/AcrR family transcriptional regulator [bacterium]